jgi:hypothetical protein
MRTTGRITILAALLALAVVAPATAAAQPTARAVAPGVSPAGVPSANSGIDPAATPETILAGLRFLNEQSKKSGSRNNQRNIAIYWNALAGRLTELGLTPPAPSSKFKKYL